MIIDIPIYIINLKHDVERKLHMQKLLEKYSLRYEFIEAVNGQLMSELEIQKIYSKNNTLNTIRRILARSEIGVALSHKYIYQKMINENIEMSIIMEDDIDFDKDLLDIINKVHTFPDNWDLVLLGHHSCDARDIETHYSYWCQKRLTDTYKLVRPTEMGCGAYGYLLKKSAALTLLHDIHVMIKPIDHYTGIDEQLNLYIVAPAVIRINQYLSDNYNSMKERRELKSSPICLNKKRKLTFKRKFLEFFHLYDIAIKVYNNLFALKVYLLKCISFYKKIRNYN